MLKDMKDYNDYNDYSDCYIYICICAQLYISSYITSNNLSNLWDVMICCDICVNVSHSATAASPRLEAHYYQYVPGYGYFYVPSPQRWHARILSHNLHWYENTSMWLTINLVQESLPQSLPWGAVSSVVLWVNQLSGDSTFHLPLSRPGQKGGAAAAVGWPRGLFGASISQGMGQNTIWMGKESSINQLF